MLKITNAKIELFTDTDMVLMTKKGIGGGLTQAIKKHAVAHNKYLPNYDKSKDLDANNLYGYAMNKMLPLSGYTWTDKSTFTTDFIKNYDDDDGDKGYLLEVDVEYPKELHSAHEDLPFLPEKRFKVDKKFELKVSKEINKAHKKVYKTFNITREADNKLIATLQDKNKYVVNMSTLRQALNHGLCLKEGHSIIEYNQANWLKPYIDKNTALRKKAKNEFEKDFFKLMNNSVSGKMIENVRKGREIKLIITEERRKKLVSEPNYASYTGFSDHLMAVEMRKTHVLMDKPILVGQAILDKSKELMYEFFYDYLKPKYQNKTKLCYMDTDSFILDIKTDYFSEDTKEDLKKWFDTCNYRKDMILPEEYAKNTNVNKKVIGKMKNKLGKRHMSEFIALSPKVYAYQQVNVDKTLSEDKKARGTCRVVTKKSLSFDRYKKCLFNNETVKCIQHRIKACHTLLI